ncbi:MAG: hypothetical protein E7598_02400 [Ruminococcaceae bacterium]|nr:hypothetical protein [Oscillospiraceae bacterium]
MKNLLYLTLGYTKFRIKNCYIKEILNIANLHCIRILGLYAGDCETVVKIYTRDEKVIFEKMEKLCVNYTNVTRYGIPEVLKKYRHRAGMILGLVLFFAVLYISPLFIWEIKVIGTEKLSSEYVCDLLEKEGVYIGGFSPLVDRKSLYRNILRTSQDISWISVNFIGSTANVEVVERDYTQAVKPIADGANIVAKKDGKILEVDVITGKLLANSETVVKKGEIIVSGIYETKKSGTRYVYSDAKVYAEVCDEYIVEIPLKNTEKVYGEESLAECSIKMFGKNVNIFKNYSILDDNYDTIYNNVNFSVLHFDRLPLSLETVTAFPYTYTDVQLTESEALFRARSEFFKILDMQDYLDTLSIEESITVENSVLVLKCSVEAVENIAAIAEFEIW